MLITTPPSAAAPDYEGGTASTFGWATSDMNWWDSVWGVGSGHDGTHADADSGFSWWTQFCTLEHLTARSRTRPLRGRGTSGSPARGNTVPAVFSDANLCERDARRFSDIRLAGYLSRLLLQWTHNSTAFTLSTSFWASAVGELGGAHELATNILCPCDFCGVSRYGEPRKMRRKSCSPRRPGVASTTTPRVATKKKLFDDSAERYEEREVPLKKDKIDMFPFVTFENRSEPDDPHRTVARNEGTRACAIRERGAPATPTWPHLFRQRVATTREWNRLQEAVVNSKDSYNNIPTNA